MTQLSDEDILAMSPEECLDFCKAESERSQAALHEHTEQHSKLKHDLVRLLTSSPPLILLAICLLIAFTH